MKTQSISAGFEPSAKEQRHACRWPGALATVACALWTVTLVACSTAPSAMQLYPGPRRQPAEVAIVRSASGPQGDKVVTQIESIDGVKPPPGKEGMERGELLPGRHTMVANCGNYLVAIRRVAETGKSTTPDLGTSPYQMTISRQGRELATIRLDDKRIPPQWEKEKARNRRTVSFTVEAGKCYVVMAQNDKDNQITGRGIWVQETLPVR